MSRRTWLYRSSGAFVGGLFALGVVVSPLPATAQFRIGLRAQYRDVLQFEAIQSFITVYNDMGQSLSVGGEGTGADLELRFVVEDSAELPEQRVGETPLCRKELLLPGARQTFLLDVTRWYRMIGVGRYRVQVEGQWHGKRYESNPVMVNVVAGLVLDEDERVQPGYSDRIRRYSLRYWRREQHEHLFLRVDEVADGASMNYGTVDLGRVIRVFPPRLTVDHEGHVKVVHQSGRDCYTRTLFRSEPDRLRFVDQTYHLPNGEPYPNTRGGKERSRRAAGAENETNNEATNDEDEEL